MPPTTPNSEWFANYVKGTRDHFGYSQQVVADAGGPHRQLQAAIEKGDEPDVTAGVLTMFDRAYGWPTGYAQALAELGVYAQKCELSPALEGDHHDAAALLDDRNQQDRNFGDVRKTFAGRYRYAERDAGSGVAYVGFHPETGEPSYLEGPLLTNVGFDLLHPMILARHGVTTIDINVADEETVGRLGNLTSGHMAEGVGQNPIQWYRVGTNCPGLGSASPIAIDPLAEITTLSEAKALATDLLRIRPHVPTTALQAGYTFLAVVAFGEDVFGTLTELKRAGTDPHAREFTARFAEFWQQFYDPIAGPDVARPDPCACDLLAGVMHGRSNGMEVRIGDFDGPRPRPRYQIPRTVTPASHMAGDTAPVVVFYDGELVPELPIVQSHMWPTRALTFYKAYLTPEGGVSPQLGRYPHHRVAITTADDRDVVARHQRHKLGTLTNYVAGQAIYCDYGRAQRVWIPDR